MKVMENLKILFREGHTLLTKSLGNENYVHVKLDEFGETYRFINQFGNGSNAESVENKYESLSDAKADGWELEGEWYPGEECECERCKR